MGESQPENLFPQTCGASPTGCQDKAEARRERRRLLRNLCTEHRTALTAALLQSLENWLVNLPPTVVLCYQPLPDEPDILPLVPVLRELGHIAALPRVAEDGKSLDIHRWDEAARLSEGHFGILEPDPETMPLLDPESVGVALIPGLAFSTASGVRLGRGGGFYDRLLGSGRFRGQAVGVALPWHLTAKLPKEAHDIPMRALATPDGVFFMPLAHAS